MTSDASDLPAALAGDAEAFARLYERHAGIVLSLCRRSSGLDDAEDAMQETFLRAYRRLHQLRSAAGFRPWLYAIAKRVCSERRRSAGRRDRHETKAADNLIHTQLEIPTPADTAENSEQLDRLTAAMDTLSDRERLAVHLYYLDPQPVRAASAVLGLSRSGYYKLLVRARTQLASSMREAQPT